MLKTNDTAPRIHHATVNTGDIQSFSLTESNFDPGIVLLARRMFNPTVMDYSLLMAEHPSGKLCFEVCAGRAKVSRNTVWRDEQGDINLSTLLLPESEDLRPDELMMLADMEQCVAIGLLEKE
jgi:hypothetical protein